MQQVKTPCAVGVQSHFMLSYPFYKWLHLVGIFVMFLSLGGLILYSALVERARQQGGVRRGLLTLNGVGMFLLLLSGFGALARLGIHWPWPGWESYLHFFRNIGYTAEGGWTFGTCYCALQEREGLIGTNDLWIAATALVHGLPVVTRNTAEFGRVHSLQVVSY